MTNTAVEIGAAKSRLATMREAVEAFDRRIAALKREESTAGPRDKRRIEVEIGSLQSQRIVATSLVDEAEAQLVSRETDHGDFVNRTRRTLNSITGDCENAAKRVDNALRAASRAIDELEAAVQPLAHAGFLPSGVKAVVRRDHIHAAFQRAFADRLGALAAKEPTMAQRTQMAMANARENAARAKALEKV